VETKFEHVIEQLADMQKKFNEMHDLPMQARRVPERAAVLFPL
jgi:hypothetical protein